MTNLRGKELHLERGASKSRTMTGRWVDHFDLVVVGVADVQGLLVFAPGHAERMLKSGL